MQWWNWVIFRIYE